MASEVVDGFVRLMLALTTVDAKSLVPKRRTVWLTRRHYWNSHLPNYRSYL